MPASLLTIARRQRTRPHTVHRYRFDPGSDCRGHYVAAWRVSGSPLKAERFLGGLGPFLDAQEAQRWTYTPDGWRRT